MDDIYQAEKRRLVEAGVLTGSYTAVSRDPVLPKVELDPISRHHINDIYGPICIQVEEPVLTRVAESNLVLGTPCRTNGRT